MCIDIFYDKDECWTASDCTSKELTDWIDTLNPKDYKKIEQFFKTMPKLSHTVEVENPNTKVKNTIVLEGLSDFSLCPWVRKIWETYFQNQLCPDATS